MDLRYAKELETAPELRHQVRHLSWFRGSFARCAELVAENWGVTYTISDERLAAAFFDWADAFAESRKYADVSRLDFAYFAAGLLLKELIGKDVAKAVQPATIRVPADSDPRFAEILRFWPEGFLYVSYCLSVLGAVLQQDFHAVVELRHEIEELRTWWSFRENVRENPALAIGFLDTFVGNEANWAQPDFALARPGMQRMLDALRGPG